MGPQRFALAVVQGGAVLERVRLAGCREQHEQPGHFSYFVTCARVGGVALRLSCALCSGALAVLHAYTCCRGCRACCGFFSINVAWASGLRH